MPNHKSHLHSAQVPSQAIRHDLLELLIHDHASRTVPALQRLWSYYRNPLSSVGDRTRSAQSVGLPPRLQAQSGGVSREQVIENDIAWRIHALADFMVGKPPIIQSRAEDSALADSITQYLRGTLFANAGHALFHDMALLGSVYGYVDILLRVNEPQPFDRLEVVAPPRSIPLLSPNDYRQLDAFLIHHEQLTHQVASPPLLGRLARRAARGRRESIHCTEVWTAERFEYFQQPTTGISKSRRRVDSMPNRLGRVPVVHIQNLPQPFRFEGLSDVEPLIPLQDELNTRLSDRANRVTFQSFKMYLGKGIDGFTDRPVGPGQMWSTDNPDATIEEFGGDASTPSEDSHIREVREAMDKASGVSPIAAGVIGGKVGNLSSENAIRIVLLGLMARIEKKRASYGEGISRMCELILHAADVTGRLPNRPEDRRVRIDWPEPFPDTQSQQIQNALAKKELDIPIEQLWAELGYVDCSHQ